MKVLQHNGFRFYTISKAGLYYTAPHFLFLSFFPEGTKEPIAAEEVQKFFLLWLLTDGGGEGGRRGTALFFKLGVPPH